MVGILQNSNGPTQDKIGSDEDFRFEIFSSSPDSSQVGMFWVR
jgi:hypothetical protein